MIPIFQSLFAPPRDLLLVLLSAWIGIGLAERRAARHQVNLDVLSNLIFWSLGGFLLGGRIFYALEHLSAFIPSPLSLFSLLPALFDPWGGLAVALIIAAANGQRNRLPLWPALDAVTPFLACLAIGIAFSHLATGQAFGQATGVPWAIDQWGEMRHPTQAYEIIAASATLIVILSIKSGSPAGREFLIFAALTAASRVVIEGFRGDSVLVFNDLRLAQVLAWLILAAALIGLELVLSRSKPEMEPSAAVDQREVPSQPHTPVTPRKKTLHGKMKTPPVGKGKK